MLCASLRRLGQASMRYLLPMESLASGATQQAASAATDHTHHTYDVGKASLVGWHEPVQDAACLESAPLGASRWSSRALPLPSASLRALVRLVRTARQATNIKFHDGMVPRETKEQLLGQKGVVLWFTGERGRMPSGWRLQVGCALALPAILQRRVDTMKRMGPWA